MTKHLSPTQSRDINRQYFETRAWGETRWEGVPSQKSPCDLFAYQELVFELRPNLIVELGTLHGGTALFLARLLDIIGRGIVVTVDSRDAQRPRHRRIEYLTGDTVSPAVLEQVQLYATDADVVMVIADSDHSKGHVLKELELYWPLVTVGSYMIVEDTNHRWLHPGSTDTPWDAVDEFVRTRGGVLIDKSFQERYVLTFCPNGYLKKVDWL